MNYMVLTLALAQLPAPQPQSVDFFADKIVMEVRLLKADGSTARLIDPKFPTVNAQYFNLTVSCWNTSSPCPEITGMKVKLFVKLPWWDVKYNITKYVLCSGSECLFPSFGPLVAKPGEAYKFRYDRVTAAWNPAPNVVVVTQPPSDPRMPPQVQLVDAEGAVWTVLPQIAGTAGQVGLARNGARVANSIDFAILKFGFIYQLDGAEWSKWEGGSWVTTAAP